MGLLIDGKWHDQWYDTKANKGKFVRSEAQFRNWITSETQNEQDAQSNFPAEKGRYHLYVSLACPWAHRTLIFRKLKSLEDIISVSCVHPDMLSNGWEFKEEQNFLDKDVTAGDPLYQSKFAHDIYTRADANYSGRVTVPILWDKKQQTIVSNESSEIIRMFNDAFNHITGNTLDFYPQERRNDIDEINEKIYHTVNNGVYKSGFATTQEAYEEAVLPLFKTLDDIEVILTNQDFLIDNQITEADWRLFTTLIRFDAVYHGHFKCNLKRIIDYPNINAYLQRLYETKGIKETVNLTHIKRHYYYSHDMINPSRVVPLGPTEIFKDVYL
ncbi:glutathione S-transferase family protein [Marinomonas mediterranea]|uniref:glutathione S-transferase family protein n=1 Tax=Marinomonas mediterranea TaxID=119864 RepID=UPI0023499CD0|nr:glutathione S-transferase family protein [Marinomonas mediterranea]WCN10457.1 glutathione S-transferase family protein [Marinomonas mediterranea]WCN14505.1 glutathione S-transferase family protein [Marinomonas mediterranea]